jgi:hypothetical protein
MFQGNNMLCINGELLERETVSAHQNARFLLDSMFKFSEQFNKLGLSDEQIGLFCAMVVLAPDRYVKLFYNFPPIMNRNLTYIYLYIDLGFEMWNLYSDFNLAVVQHYTHWSLHTWSKNWIEKSQT